MSKKFFKTISLAVITSLMISLFAACSGNGANNKPANTATEQKKSEPVTIDWLAYNCYGQPDPESEIVKQVEQWYNAKFNFWYIDDQKWDEVLGVKLSSGEMPDIMRVKDTANLGKYVKQGVVAEVTKDMMDKMPAYKSVIEKYDTDKNIWVDAMVDGKIYTLKGISLGGAYPTTLVWNKQWLKNVGINKIPETLTEWENAMYKFANNDPDKNGKKDTYGMSNTTISAVFGAFGAIPLKEFRGTGTQNLFMTKKDGKVTFAAIQPEMKEALALLQKWYKDGVIDPEFITGENKGGYWAVSQAFDNGRIGVTGMSMAAHWNPPLYEGANGGACYTEYMKVNPNAKLGETFDLGKAPVGPKGKSGTHQWGAIGGGGVSFTTKGVKDKQKVDIMLKMIQDNFADFERSTYLTYGVKDTHYKVNAGGAYIATEQYNNSADKAKAGISVLSVIGNPDFQKKWDPKIYEFYDKYKGPGYADERVPQTDANTKFSGDLKKLTLETYIQIISGQKNVDAFDEFVTTFKQRGGEQIEKEVNEALAKTTGK